MNTSTIGGRTGILDASFQYGGFVTVQFCEATSFVRRFIARSEKLKKRDY